MIKRIVVIFMLLLAAINIPGIARAEERRPQRIVSLGPTITEKLYLLGVQDRLIGVTIYCQRPAEAARKEKIGNVTHVNVEKIIQLKPDLVIATELTDARAVKKLRAAEMRLIIFPEPKSFFDLNKQFVDLGRLVGKEQEARKIASAADEKVEALRSKAHRYRLTRVLVQIGANPLFVATGGTVLNDLIELANGVNIAAAAKVGFYSVEEVLRQNPEVIIIVTMGVTAENEIRRWQKFSGIDAVRNRRIAVMDPYETCSPTPVSFVRALTNVVNILHPESKADVR